MIRSLIQAGFRGALLAACACGPAAAQGAFSYPNCADVAEGQFRYVPLVSRRANSTVVGAPAPKLVDASLTEPIHMDFDLRPGNQVDIYFTERGGNVKRYDAAKNAVSVLGSIPVSNDGEMGLTGIALDPGFKANHRLYAFYTSPDFELRLSRFTLDASGNLNVTGEKVLLRIKSYAHRHMGGALAFDSYGDLWITTGNDVSDYPSDYSETARTGNSEGSSANLADLRGGVLRIHPDDSPRGYSIPQGNFSQYWAEQFRANGKAALANEYADTSKVKPEIYAKGTRNAYSISVDPTRRWVSYGNFGVNTNRTYTEAHYLFTHPAFAGYPYFAGGFGSGNGTGYYELWKGEGASQFAQAHPGLFESIAGPVNNSVWNLGPKQLPPVSPALHTYMHGSGAGAVTGPIYRYDGNSASTVKWPPHFDGAWMVTDWTQAKEPNGFQGMKIFKLSPTGDGIVDSLKLFEKLGWFRPVSLQQGPDGAIYLIMYHGWFGSDEGTHIARIEYTGSCLPKVSGVLGDARSEGLASLGAGRLAVAAAGPFALEVRNAGGRLFQRLGDRGPRSYALADLAPGARGLLLITVSAAQGTRTLAVYRDAPLTR